MYELKFQATDDADWAEAIEIINGRTSQPLAEAADATFELEVSDCGSAVLTASSEDGTIEHPEDNIIQWVFTKAQMSALQPRKTYAVGCTMTIASGTIQLFVGSLAVIDGGF